MVPCPQLLLLLLLSCRAPRPLLCLSMQPLLHDVEALMGWSLLGLLKKPPLLPMPLVGSRTLGLLLLNMPPLIPMLLVGSRMLGLLLLKIPLLLPLLLSRLDALGGNLLNAMLQGTCKRQKGSYTMLGSHSAGPLVPGLYAPLNTAHG